VSQKELEETNKSARRAGRMHALRIMCIRVLGPYIIVLVVVMGKMRFKLKQLVIF